MASADNEKVRVFRLDPAAGSPRAVPPLGDERLWIVNWSPDGKWLAGRTAKGGIVRPGLVLYSFEKGTIERITDRGRGWTWLPGGEGLLFEDGGRIFQLELATRRVREVDPLVRKVHFDDDRAMSISNDGRRLYRIVHSIESDIWQLNLPEANPPR